MTGQLIVCKYRQQIMTKFGVPTSAAWILSNQGRFIFMDVSKKVNIDRQSDSSLRSVIKQLILRFWVIVGKSESHKPIWIWKPQLGICYAPPLCLLHQDTDLTGCLRHRNWSVRWQQTTWMLDTIQSMEICTSKCLRINNYLSRDIPFRIKVIAIRFSVSS